MHNTLWKINSDWIYLPIQTKLIRAIWFITVHALPGIWGVIAEVWFDAEKGIFYKGDKRSAVVSLVFIRNLKYQFDIWLLKYLFQYPDKVWQIKSHLPSSIQTKRNLNCRLTKLANPILLAATRLEYSRCFSNRRLDNKFGGSSYLEFLKNLISFVSTRNTRREVTFLLLKVYIF